jgi:hypothetical protein
VAVDDKQNGCFHTRARPYGSKRFEAVGEPTQHIQIALHRMREAFDDERKYQQVEVQFVPDDENEQPRTRVIMTKKNYDDD